jgi:drug/metabolite transporter (DMT)-like permease
MAIVGSSVVVGKLVVAKVPIFLIGGLRFGLALLILVPLVLIRERGLPALSRSDAGVLLAQAFTGIFAFNVLLLYGLTFTTAAESGIVTSTTPAVAAALAVLLLREPWTSRRAAGIVMAVLGLIALNLEGMTDMGGRGPRPLLGNLLVLGAVVGEGLFVVCSRVLAQRLSPLTVAAGISVLGEPMRPSHLVGAACVVAGIVLVARETEA